MEDMKNTKVEEHFFNLNTLKFIKNMSDTIEALTERVAALEANPTVNRDVFDLVKLVNDAAQSHFEPIKERVTILEAVAVAEAPDTLQTAQTFFKAAKIRTLKPSELSEEHRQTYTGSAEGVEVI
ncbi:hypothetical protein B9R80_002420 [Salmonella enterica]|nr:hypothetical protein [Salmonella enterica]